MENEINVLKELIIERVSQLTDVELLALVYGLLYAECAQAV